MTRREFVERYPQFRGRRLHIPYSEIDRLFELRRRFPTYSKSGLARTSGISRPSVRRLLKILEGE